LFAVAHRSAHMLRPPVRVRTVDSLRKCRAADRGLWGAWSQVSIEDYRGKAPVLAPRNLHGQKVTQGQPKAKHDAESRIESAIDFPAMADVGHQNQTVVIEQLAKQPNVSHAIAPNAGHIPGQGAPKEARVANAFQLSPEEFSYAALIDGSQCPQTLFCARRDHQMPTRAVARPHLTNTSADRAPPQRRQPPEGNPLGLRGTGRLPSRHNSSSSCRSFRPARRAASSGPVGCG